jgi:hypothetical protein
MQAMEEKQSKAIEGKKKTKYSSTLCDCIQCGGVIEQTYRTIGQHRKTFGTNTYAPPSSVYEDNSFPLNDLECEVNYDDNDDDFNQDIWAWWTDYNQDNDGYKKNCDDMINKLVVNFLNSFVQHNEAQISLMTHLSTVKEILRPILPPQIYDGIPTTINAILKLLKCATSDTSRRYTLCPTDHHYIFPYREIGSERDKSEKCPKCNVPRYHVTPNGTLTEKEFMVYFPVTPRIRRLWANRCVAQLMLDYYNEMATPNDWYTTLFYLRNID